MRRLVISGADADILPLLETLRAGPAKGVAEVIGVLPDDSTGIAALCATIMGLPGAEGPDGAGWADTGALLVGETSRGETARLARWSHSEARARAGIVEPAAAGTAERKRAVDTGSGAEREQQPTTGGKSPDKQRTQRSAAAPAPARESRIADPERGFAAELQREIRRSARYHLGFCLTLLRIENAAGECPPAAAWAAPPLVDLVASIGRGTDSWGLGEAGVLMHLAPEIQEQARLMRRRLERDIAAHLAALPAGPWSVLCGQARFPQDGESGAELIAAATGRLRRASGGRGA